MADLILEIVEGEEAGKQVALGGAIEIGRDQAAGLPLRDSQVSRRHVRVAPSGPGAVVEDLGSTNGTYVNDQPIPGPRELRPGDRVRMGLTVLELRNSAQVAQRPSAVQKAPAVTALDHGVLAPVPEEQLPAAEPAANAASLLVEESEPAFLPREAATDEEAQSDYAALAALVDPRVKRQTTVATFALLAVAGLAVLIFFGVR